MPVFVRKSFRPAWMRSPWMRKPIQNIGASVRARLLNLAKERNHHQRVCGLRAMGADVP